jgi:hypothetical protein
MKNIFVALTFFSIILSSCKNESNHRELLQKQNSDRPTQAISYPDMASMFKEYDNGQRIVLDEYITNKTQGRDSISTISQFFSLSEIKQYIAYIERLSEEKKIDLTGIRIFTSAYPSDYKVKEYQNRVSFILAPTANIGAKKNVAYEPLKSTTGNPVSMKSILDEYADETTKRVNRASVFSLSLKEADDSSALNRGQITPPY